MTWIPVKTDAEPEESRMLQAQLKGKLTRGEEDLEDLLTSNVFGSIKYIPPEEALLPLLASSRDGFGNAPIHVQQPVSSVDYSFWQWIQEPGCQGCEPDVIITIQLMGKQKIIILVEAKYLSDKSSESTEQGTPTDQLAREWDNLTYLAKREDATPILLYVTADLGYPKKSIESSLREYMQKRKREMSVFWISWRKLPTLFSDKEQEILKDLVKVLRRQGLTFFEGITKPDPIDFEWSFRTVVNWVWSSFDECTIHWEYRTGKTYNWQHKTEHVDWRFEK